MKQNFCLFPKSKQYADQNSLKSTKFHKLWTAQPPQISDTVSLIKSTTGLYRNDFANKRQKVIEGVFVNYEIISLSFLIYHFRF